MGFEASDCCRTFGCHCLSTTALCRRLIVPFACLALSRHFRSTSLDGLPIPRVRSCALSVVETRRNRLRAKCVLTRKALAFRDEPIGLPSRWRQRLLARPRLLSQLSPQSRLKFASFSHAPAPPAFRFVRGGCVGLSGHRLTLGGHTEKVW